MTAYRILAPSQIVGHTPVCAAPGDWRCRCGAPLAASKKRAFRAMSAHRAAVAAETTGDESPSSFRDYRARRRQDPHVAAVEAWQNRTRYAALSMLARKFPAEYLTLLDEVREADPRPAAEEASGERAA